MRDDRRQEEIWMVRRSPSNMVETVLYIVKSLQLDIGELAATHLANHARLGSHACRNSTAAIKHFFYMLTSCVGLFLQLKRHA